MDEKSNFYDLYLKLMESENNGKLIWEKIRDKELSAAPCFAGNMFEKSKARLMVIGRAVNGWEIDFFENCIDAYSTTEAILSQSYDFNAIINPKGIPSIDTPQKRNYFYSSSRFWRLIKYLLEEYNESDCSTQSVDSWYTDEQHWNQRILWSNLYKVAPRNGNNPEWQLIKPQMQTYIDIVKEEIEVHKPEHILFVTDWNYFAPWKREPSFAEDFNIHLTQENYGSNVVAKGIFNNRKMIVCKRPDIRGTSYQNVAEMAKKIKCVFDKL